MNKRIGDWIETSEGISFYPFDPRQSEINILDIAHSLSMQCRFAGHCIQFYSIAEHCCHIHDRCSSTSAFYGLMHDASEAYLLDIPRPIKNNLVGYKEQEKIVMDMIIDKYEIPYSDFIKDEVKWFDNAILFKEAEQNMKNGARDWLGYDPSLTEQIDLTLEYWNPKRAKEEFLDRFDKSLNTIAYWKTQEIAW